MSASPSDNAKQTPQTGDATGGASGETPPLTNRGCFTPTADAGTGGKKPVLFRIDYLKFTLFVSRQHAQQIIESELLERAGCPAAWIEHGPVARWACRYEGPLEIMALEPKSFEGEYTTIELKGMACTMLGPEVLQGFLAYLCSCGERWNGLRIDLAFDHVSFTPRQVNRAIKRGDIRSRSLKAEDRDWYENAMGCTVYLGKRKGKTKKTKVLRVYDMRGFTRCEAEYHKEWAETVMRALAAAKLDEWPRIGLEFLRGVVDFVRSKANPRIDRCPLLPWWAELVGDAGKIQNIPDDARREVARDVGMTAIATSERRIMRSARPLWAILKAFGPDYVCKRLMHYTEGRIRPEDEKLAEELAKWKYSGYAGLPTERPSEEADDAPF